MVRKAFLLVTGLSAALVTAAPQASAQKGAPRVRVINQTHSSIGTIEPTISLSEPSYILAVAIDRDGQVTVLSPVGPNDIIRFESAKQLRLPEFFSGFSTVGTAGDYFGGYSNNHYASYIRSVTDDYSAGSVLVLASRTPFNFAAISQGPFWNEDAIKKLVRYRDPSSAVYALGRAVTAKGQSYGHDYLRFGARRYQLASADPCAGIGSAPWGFASYDMHSYSVLNQFGGYGGGFIITPATATSPGLRMINLGIDACGRTRFVVVPIRQLEPKREPVPVPVDSATVPKPESKIATAPGTYYGDDAVRVFEMIKTRNTSDTYVGLPMSPILKDKEDGPLGRPVTRDASPGDKVESFERVRSPNATPIERSPILRSEEPRQAQPVMRNEPVMRSEPVRSEPVRSEPVRSEPVRSEPMRSAPTVQRESKPAEVSSTIKDNQ